ncbi:hypothetical protein HanRHA438_Chr11g0520381 [Helianthus annuus]|nr:hypothetical protein HanRHA438_Chr11g0520381 [Helianthus annuus]
MILLANYSVHSMSHNFAIAPETTTVTTTTVESVSETKFDSSSVKTFVTNSGGKTLVEASRGGDGGWVEESDRRTEAPAS